MSAEENIFVFVNLSANILLRIGIYSLSNKWIFSHSQKWYGYRYGCILTSNREYKCILIFECEYEFCLVHFSKCEYEFFCLTNYLGKESTWKQTHPFLLCCAGQVNGCICIRNQTDKCLFQISVFTVWFCIRQMSESALDIRHTHVCLSV